MIARLALLVAALMSGAVACDGGVSANKPPREKSDIYLLTSLPLLFGESFGLDNAAAPVVAALERHHSLKPIEMPSNIPDGATLLAAQPRALPAEELVVLDAWVRRGGKLILLADPMLEWPSERPLGDLLRPPVAYPDTGLLGHWGLRLDAPDERGLTSRSVANMSINALSPGALVKVSGECTVADDKMVARCTLGEGSVLVIADADWLDVASIDDLGGNGANNLEALVSLLSHRE